MSDALRAIGLAVKITTLLARATEARSQLDDILEDGDLSDEDKERVNKILDQSITRWDEVSNI